MTVPRVLVVEDDLNVRRFIQVTLDPLEAELVHCGTLAEAQRALESAGASVVITDLSLPDGFGQDLLAWIQARAGAGAPACRAVVFSGGIDAAAERQLALLGAWRVLHKPSSVGALMACVSEALASVSSALPVAGPDDQTPAHDPADEFFGGDRGLYDTYRLACRAQFALDLRAGDVAVSVRDSAALQRVAHNLKSVLTMLGEAEAAACARSTEEWAAAAAGDAMAQGWQRLRAHVARML
jgi:DNA-binding response OmpR family regulator